MRPIQFESNFWTILWEAVNRNKAESCDAYDISFFENITKAFSQLSIEPSDTLLYDFDKYPYIRSKDYYKWKTFAIPFAADCSAKIVWKLDTTDNVVHVKCIRI